MDESIEHGVDSRYHSKEEQESESVKLMQARLDRMKNLSKGQVRSAKLVQLKLKMENYLKNPVYDSHNYFTDFLRIYIDSIYSKHSEFAVDMNITPVFLSQLINNHREPKDEFIMKLMIHSEKAFANVCDFQEENWYQVYFQEKICDTMSNREKWKPKLEKQIKLGKLLEI
ncbi:hypothetical protein [Sphingobacterium hungaricum]|nr:hypothetical protein [Sphingobacterium hungaricum]